ncbi:MAG: FHA domain-containing protein, partial [Myxococcales bacterium]|nr:FHA domain-containing protein [Myxococcales bacterium]
MISCPSCTKQNQDHYRFCLGCGQELPRAAPASEREEEDAEENTQVGARVAPSHSPFAPAPAITAPAPSPLAAVLAPAHLAAGLAPAHLAAGLAPAHLAAGLAPASVLAPVVVELPPGMCSECETINPPTNRFCASCGARIAAPKAAAPAPAPSPDPGSGAIFVALDSDGTEIGRYGLPRGESVVGRDTGGVFASDVFLSPMHAVVTATDGRVRVRDNGSLNGIFRKLIAEQSVSIEPGQCFRIGQELLRFDALDSEGGAASDVEIQGAESEGMVGRVSLIVGRERREPSVGVPARGLHLGRERGDITFGGDGYVSGLHCHLGYANGSMHVTDLGSSNGTFVQLLGEHEIN